MEYQELPDSKYGKYIINNPLLIAPDYVQTEDIKGVTFPNEIFMSSDLVKNAPVIIDIGWCFTVPDPVEKIHSHPYDTILCLVGSDSQNSSNLGAILEIKLGEEKHVLTQTCAIYIPKGLEHALLIHKEVSRAYLKIEFALTGANSTK